MTTHSNENSAASGASKEGGASRGYGEELYAGRTLAGDMGFLLPHLRPGMCVADCGCGPGSITVAIAELVAPGEVDGIDLVPEFIEKAQALAAERGVKNLRFQVGNVYDPPLGADSFDVVLFSGVLAHLPEPERALGAAYGLLRSGGLIAAREPQKGGDWFGGPYREALEYHDWLVIEDWKRTGSDPMIGRRLPTLLKQAGFVRIEAMAGYSTLHASVQRMGPAVLRLMADPEFGARLTRRGLVTPEHLERLTEEIKCWMESDESVIAIAQCAALAWKP